MTGETKMYILIAMKDKQVSQCIVVEDADLARGVFNRLIEVYGAANVAMHNKIVNDVPVELWFGYGKTECCT